PLFRWPNSVCHYSMDLIVTSMRTHSDYGIPTLNGAALLTGINDDALKQEIKALLTQ
ncbi:TPA: hypothetical protein ACGKDF_004691, partial [Salmonella enterica]